MSPEFSNVLTGTYSISGAHTFKRTSTWWTKPSLPTDSLRLVFFTLSSVLPDMNGT